MKNRIFIPVVLFVFLLHAALLRSQQVTVQIETGKQIVLTRSDLEAIPRSRVTTGASDVATTFEGVTLKAVLDKAGVGFGGSMKGKRLASCLLVEAADGYRVVIALPEIDPAFSDKEVVLAFLSNGKPLDDKEGPYRIVIPGEKRMARGVRQGTALNILKLH